MQITPTPIPDPRNPNSTPSSSTLTANPTFIQAKEDAMFPSKVHPTPSWLANHLQGVDLNAKRRDPGAPKRGLSAYMFFANDARDKVREENPGLSCGQIGLYLGEMWKALSPGERSHYEEMAVRDRRRYEDELAGYMR